MSDILIDGHRRPLTYLRVSITDRCNLRCLYCAPAGPFAKLDHREILSYEEILRVVRIGTGLGITKVRVTGGEPLVRRGVDTFLSRLTAVPGLADVSLTTNGVQLDRHLDAIRDAGIRRLNISLDAIDPLRFRRITRRDRFDQVWRGIMAAQRAGMAPIKINTVALGGINDGQIERLARLTYDHPFHVRFIEYMPLGAADPGTGPRLNADKILARLGAVAPLTAVGRGHLDGPADRYRLQGALGEIGIIAAMSHRFCHRCNRLRLTASGRLRTCLLDNQSIDIKSVLRGGGADAEIEERFFEAARRKQERHHLDESGTGRIAARMSAIGG